MLLALERGHMLELAAMRAERTIGPDMAFQPFAGLGFVMENGGFGDQTWLFSNLRPIRNLWKLFECRAHGFNGFCCQTF